MDKNGIVDVAQNGNPNELLQQEHYYPFGMGIKGEWKFVQPQIGGVNLEQFNGIELNEDFGLNWNMAFYRSYDPSIGRWGQIDPLAEKYFSMSSYNGMGNNPLINGDPKGDSLVNPRRSEMQEIANDLNKVYKAKYNFENAFNVTSVKRKGKVKTDDNIWNLWGLLGSNTETVDVTKYALAVNPDFDWNTDKYTAATFDLVSVDGDILVDIIPDSDQSFLKGFGGGFTDSPYNIRLSDKLTTYGKNQGTMGQFVNKWSLGMVFLHEGIYHLHPLGLNEEKKFLKNGATGPNVMRYLYQSRTGKNHGAGSNQNPMLRRAEEKKRLSMLRAKTGRK